VDALPDTMMRISRDGVIRDGTYKQYSGLGIKTDAATESIEALAASNMRDLPLPEEILDMYSSAITQALESEQLREFEYSIDDCDEPRHFEARVVKSGADEVVAIIRDITEATRTREALRTAIRKLSAANYELKEFAYIASHDLQEPLRTVRNFSELLEQRYRKSLDERGSRWLQRINGNAARMQTLIDDLLMYSGVGRNAARSEVDAGAVVRTLLEDVAAGIHMAGAEITVGELPQVWVNKTELRQVFQNLIVNALKFRRPEVSPRIEIIAEANDDRWQFTVRDNGIGIAPEHQDRIFKVFKRLHDRSEYAGNGIGLALVKKVVTHHGGNITVHSQPGQGSEFRFTLPAVPPRAPSQ
ncbi:MAG: ATP-binding protein, partial [Myxococcota bacterium]